MPYPINQRAHQFNSIQSVPVSFGLWDTALKFLSPGPRNDVTDHLAVGLDKFCWQNFGQNKRFLRRAFCDRKRDVREEFEQNKGKSAAQMICIKLKNKQMENSNASTTHSNLKMNYNFATHNEYLISFWELGPGS